MMSEYELSEYFYELFSNIPRQGPGSDEYTRKAYLSLPGLPRHPDILDIGCGSGMQTLELARISGGQITAVDNYQPYLDELNKRARIEGLERKIQTVNRSMLDLPYDAGSFDVIWSEGAIFIIGFEKGLKEWKPLLKVEGCLVVSELTWIKEDIPAEIRTFMEEVYPVIKTIEENREIIRQTGYHEVTSFILPESGWWNNFYEPLQQRIPKLRKKYIGNKEALEVLDAGQAEIDMYRKYSSSYGYVFYLMQAK
jgi:ubiquinone/menaquinone biosynthesis C-methylase UbiE